MRDDRTEFGNETITCTLCSNDHFYNELVICCLVTNLPVNSSNDSSPDPHAHDKTAMEVLVQEERLNNGSQKEENSIEIALPVRLIQVLSEVDHQSRGKVT